MSAMRNEPARGDDKAPVSADATPHELNDILSRLQRAAQGADRVSVGTLVDAMGRSSMAAVLLVPALLLISPLSGVPGASIMGGTMIALIAGQIVLQRQKVWLPEFLRARRLPAATLQRALGWLRRPARRLDGLATPRPDGEEPWWTRILAVICLGLGLTMPLMEILPFASSIIATLVAALALAMLTGRLSIAVVATVLAGLAAAGVTAWLF